MALPAEPRTIGEIDLFSYDAARELATTDGPCVSVFMPTHRHGPETLQGPVRLRNLLSHAERRLHELGLDESSTRTVLAPLRSLVDDAGFWQRQCDGLALFAAPGWSERYRLPVPFDEQVVVGDHFRVRPLVHLLSGDATFFVLALSQNAVRLLEGTRFRIGELALGPIPASMAEALAHEDPERQLQFRSGGAGTAMFHGHGAGDEVDKATLERYLRAVDRGLRERIGQSGAPLVLASVGYYLPVFRSVSRYAPIVDGVIEGNPEHRSAEELHARALTLVEPLAASTRDETVDRFHAERGTGRTADAPEDVIAAAAEGRVDTLLVAEPPTAAPGDEAAVAVEVDPVEDPVDRAALDTIRNGGHVFVVERAMLPSALAAILRY